MYLADFKRFIDSIATLQQLIEDTVSDGLLQTDAPAGINAVQALIIFNIADKKLTCGQVRTKGIYRGSNATYNIKKLKELGYLLCEPDQEDRRQVFVSLTAKGQQTRNFIETLLMSRCRSIKAKLDDPTLEETLKTHAEVQRHLTEQIRDLY